MLAGVTALAVALVRTGDRELVLDAYALFLGALALRVLVGAIRLAAPPEASPFEAALRRPAPAPVRPESLEELERTILLATETAIDWHVRLRPLLQEVARDRLATRHGLDLEAPSARALVVDAWPLVRPDAAPPAERFEKGVRVEDLRAAVVALERI